MTTKRAVVTLKEGYAIDIFGGPVPVGQPETTLIEE